MAAARNSNAAQKEDKPQVASRPEAEEVKLPKQESTPEAQAEEEKTASEIKQQFEIPHYEGDMQKLWPRIMEHVQPPSLRRSLTDAKISQTDDSTITLTFGSRFHMEKANLVESRSKIEKAITHLTKKNMKVLCVVDPLGAKPAEQPQEKKEKVAKPNTAKTAMEIFGNDE